MKKEELKAFLDAKYLEYNRPDFIDGDPVSIPHRFQRKEDIEIAGLMAALLAWGRRDQIIKAADRLMGLMWDAPFDFVMEAGDDELAGLQNFVYRTFQGEDGEAIVRGLRRIYQEMGGLEEVMSMHPAEKDTWSAIIGLREAMISHPEFPDRTQKHLANPGKGSSAKRLNMYLRWMVRNDGRGVDFGIWKGISPAQLICPLDVHTGNVGRALGLVTRKQNDWKAALELTEGLREMDPKDPTRYDFSLFGLGIFEGF
jgi:uncharacterized protein (TIGR02757 family)